MTEMNAGTGVFSASWPSVTGTGQATRRVVAVPEGRYEEMARMLDRIGENEVRGGKVTWSGIRRAVGDDRGMWKSLVSSVACGEKNEAVAYCRSQWPEIMEAIELKVASTARAGMAGADAAMAPRSGMTFKQKVIASLRRLAAPEELDVSNESSDDAKCDRFIRRIGQHGIMRSFGDGAKRPLGQELGRILSIRMAPGKAIRMSGVGDARSVLRWSLTQDSLERDTLVPGNLNDGMSWRQRRVMVAKGLIETGCSEQEMLEGVGIELKSARRLVRETMRRGLVELDVVPKGANAAERLRTSNDLQSKGEIDLAQSMLNGDGRLSAWVEEGLSMPISLLRGGLKLVTADLDQAELFTRWASSMQGELNTSGIFVRVTRKDGELLAGGFMQSIRKTLKLEEEQVEIAAFDWSKHQEVAKARGQIVMSLEVRDATTLGKARGMLALASAALRKTTGSRKSLEKVDRAFWEKVLVSKSEAAA